MSKSSASKPRRADQRAANLGDDNLRPVVDVRRREPQDAIAGVHDQVLPLVIGDEAIAMVPSVVLDHEPGIAIQEVSPADETGLRVVELDLNFGYWQARAVKEPPQAGFHRRVGRRRQLNQPAEAFYSRQSGSSSDVFAERVLVRFPQTERHIDRNERFHRWLGNTNVTKSPVKRWHPLVLDRDHIFWWKHDVAHDQTSPRANATGRRYSHFDIIASEIEAVDQRCRYTDEHSVGRQPLFPVP
jgi:hypothetical protein